MIFLLHHYLCVIKYKLCAMGFVKVALQRKSYLMLDKCHLKLGDYS